MSSIRIPVLREYSPAPVCYGGGFAFPELNDGIPWRTDEEWSRLLLEAGVKCEWPECDTTAVAIIPLSTWAPCLCQTHRDLCVEPPVRRRRAAMQVIKDQLRDKVLIISYGSAQLRGTVVPPDLSAPYVPYDQRTPPPTPKPKRELPPVRTLSLPKLGQNHT